MSAKGDKPTLSIQGTQFKVRQWLRNRSFANGMAQHAVNFRNTPIGRPSQDQR
jgi:hypothetical protein